MAGKIKETRIALGGEGEPLPASVSANKRKRSPLVVLYALLGGMFVSAIALFSFVVYLTSLASTLPDLQAEANALLLQERSTVYASDGTIVAELYGEQDRKSVPIDEVAPVACEAIVAIEDKRFYEHGGIDPHSIMRALSANIEAGEVEQGGSTITQQTVKQLYTNKERTLSRKIKEALLALSLETRADKDTVLETYMNTIYFGHGAYGIESAANRFFSKTAKELTVSEAALIAGCIQRPSATDPFLNPEAALKRRNVVLSEMKAQGYIDSAVCREALAAPLGLNPPQSNQKTVAPYFVEYVKRELIRELGQEKFFQGGLEIYTTLDLNAQEAAEKAAEKALPLQDDPEAAVASLRYGTGEVVALVGGRDFAANPFDLATQGKRQTGSAFKPFVLATAFEQGVSPEAKYDASPFSTKVKDDVWHVENYENSIKGGYYSLQQATAASINTVFARLVMDVGPENVVKVAHKMGIVSKINSDPAIALGGLSDGVAPLEMASAFGTIANGGKLVSPTAIIEVIDANSEVVYEPSKEAQRAISADSAQKLASILHSVYKNGTGVTANCGHWAAVKTGTSQSWSDAWLVGYSGDIATAVWVGYRGGMIPMTNVHGIKVTGGSFPAQIWGSYMKDVLDAAEKQEVSTVEEGN